MYARHGAPVSQPPGPTPDQLQHYWDDLNNRMLSQQELLARIEQHLHTLSIRSKRQAHVDSIVLNAPGATPSTGMKYIVQTREYLHNRLWLPAATSVIVTMRGVTATLPLVVGWNATDFVDQAELSIAAGQVQAVLELTDEVCT